MTDTAPTSGPQHGLRFAPDVVLQTTADEALLLKLGQETAFVLNATAARVAVLIARELSLETIVDRLSSEYGCASETIAHDVRELVKTLHANGLLLDREQS